MVIHLTVPPPTPPTQLQPPATCFLFQPPSPAAQLKLAGQAVRAFEVAPYLSRCCFSVALEIKGGAAVPAAFRVRQSSVRRCISRARSIFFSTEPCTPGRGTCNT